MFVSYNLFFSGQILYSVDRSVDASFWPRIRSNKKMEKKISARSETILFILESRAIIDDRVIEIENVSRKPMVPHTVYVIPFPPCFCMKHNDINLTTL